MNSNDWRDKWEQDATAERRRQDKTPVAQLLADIQHKKFGEHYGIWYSVGERATLQQAGWILFNILQSDVDYLHRYHCAAALIKLAWLKQFEPVQLSGGNHPYRENLQRVEEILKEQLGSKSS